MEQEGPGALADLAVAVLTLVCIVGLGTVITEWLGVSGAAEWAVGVVVVIAVVVAMLVGYWIVFLSDARPAA